MKQVRYFFVVRFSETMYKNDSLRKILLSFHRTLLRRPVCFLVVTNDHEIDFSSFPLIPLERRSGIFRLQRKATKKKGSISWRAINHEQHVGPIISKSIDQWVETEEKKIDKRQRQNLKSAYYLPEWTRCGVGK